MKTGERIMAAQIHNHLKLVSETKERSAVEYIVGKMRFLYPNWDREDLRWSFDCSRKDSDALRKKVWLMALSQHNSETMLYAFDYLLRGNSEFNVNPPTPMEFAELCGRLKKGQGERCYGSEDFPDRF
jgi:hypothetical protein